MRICVAHLLLCAALTMILAPLALAYDQPAIRHSPDISRDIAETVYAIDIVASWLNRTGKNAVYEHLVMAYESGNSTAIRYGAEKLLKLIMNGSELTIVAPASVIRALKLLSGEQSQITYGDVVMLAESAARMALREGYPEASKCLLKQLNPHNGLITLNDLDSLISFTSALSKKHPENNLLFELSQTLTSARDSVRQGHTEGLDSIIGEMAEEHSFVIAAVLTLLKKEPFSNASQAKPTNSGQSHADLSPEDVVWLLVLVEKLYPEAPEILRHVPVEYLINEILSQDYSIIGNTSIEELALMLSQNPDLVNVLSIEGLEALRGKLPTALNYAIMYGQKQGPEDGGLGAHVQYTPQATLLGADLPQEIKELINQVNERKIVPPAEIRLNSHVVWGSNNVQLASTESDWGWIEVAAVLALVAVVPVTLLTIHGRKGWFATVARDREEVGARVEEFSVPALFWSVVQEVARVLKIKIEGHWTHREVVNELLRAAGSRRALLEECLTKLMFVHERVVYRGDDPSWYVDSVLQTKKTLKEVINLVAG